MKTRIAGAVFTVLLAATAAAAGEKGGFIGVEGAASFVHPVDVPADDISMHPGFAAGLIGGYDFGKVRVQGELTYRQNTVNDGRGTVALTSLAANGLYDIADFGNVTPFVGGGIGVGYIDFRDTVAGASYIDDGTMVGLFQAVAGTAVKLAPKVYLDLSYRFVVAPFEVKQGGDEDTSVYLNQNVMLGLRFGL